MSKKTSQRQQVIDHLKIVHTWADFANEKQMCLQRQCGRIAEWTMEAIEYLSKRTAKAVIEGGPESWYYVCDECHTAIDRKDKFCRECGLELQWE